MNKAFDSLRPPLMLSKLRAYGFHENTINLIRSYLCDRFNRVRMGSLTSTRKQINRGCPQGSALGPLLWNIFQNDLIYDVNSNLFMYADDHQIYEIGENLHTVNCKLNKNAAKASGTNAIYSKGTFKKIPNHDIIRYRQGNDGVCVNILGSDIQSSDSLKLLGTTIDSKMNFNDHISTVCKKASQRVGVIMRLRNLIFTAAKLQLYKAAILPHLTYCHLTWHFCRASDTRKLERVQERGLRAVFKDKHSSYKQLLERAALPTVLNRRL